ncbi:YlcI/YnfO family protein [Rosenbergiella epipactidis]|uniref:YlcI/YnfO family protein n=1 Tax=Rosenbergiella epipactidis TaxID=1544694 RepID=UPI001F4DAE86|nr:YlcI/YnfO family protein [Rosenbergiella epipactidis]
MQDEKEKKAFDRKGSTMKHIRFEDSLLEDINAVAGKGNFSSWVKDSCRDRLRREKKEPKG